MLWTAFYTACQTRWWQAIAFANMAVCAVFAVVWLINSSFPELVIIVDGFVLMAGTTANLIKTRILYRRARDRMRALDTGLDQEES
jgi:hypothetical protein